MNLTKTFAKNENDVLINNDFIRDPTLTINEKMVYVILASHCSSENNECNPSIRSQLTVETGLSARSLILMLRSLEAKGLIEIVKKSGRSTNTYILN